MEASHSGEISNETVSVVDLSGKEKSVVDLWIILIFSVDNGATDYPSFRGRLKQLVGPLSTQLSDRRSSMVKQECEPPAFEVLPSIKRLKQRIIAASRGQYDAVFMSGSGSTIVGIGNLDPPQFIYDEDEYKDVSKINPTSLLAKRINGTKNQLQVLSPMTFPRK